MSRRKRRPKPLPVEELTASNLPCEIINQILLRLPAKSLIRFKCVSKSWKEVISDTQFIQSHHDLSKKLQRKKIFCRLKFDTIFSTLYPENLVNDVESLYFPRYRNSYVLSSCDGFVLLAVRADQVFYFWNPSIRRYTKIVGPNHFANSRIPYGKTMTGVCYDSSSDDYKVVVFTGKFYYVYSLRNNSWGNSKMFSYSGINSTPSVSVNGALHWVATRKRGDVMANGIGFYSQLDNQPFNSFDPLVGNSLRDDFECDESNTHEIVYFDPKEENFNIMPRPELVDEHCAFYLTDLQGCLGLYYYSYDRRKMKIWLRTGHDSYSPSSWEKCISISNMPVLNPRCCYRVRPLCFTLENELIIHTNTGDFFLYNVDEEKFIERDDAPNTTYMGVVTYVDSLLLPGVNDKPKRRWTKTEKRDPSITGTPRPSNSLSLDS